MATNIKNITVEELQKFIPDKEVIKDARAVKESLYTVGHEEKIEEIDPLIDLEITIRKCRRTGVFKK